MLQVLLEWSEAFSKSSLIYDSSNRGQFDCLVMISSCGKFPNEGNRNKVLVGISLSGIELELGSFMTRYSLYLSIFPEKHGSLED
jgi:hypothetical protein